MRAARVLEESYREEPDADVLEELSRQRSLAIAALLPDVEMAVERRHWATAADEISDALRLWDKWQAQTKAIPFSPQPAVSARLQNNSRAIQQAIGKTFSHYVAGRQLLSARKLLQRHKAFWRSRQNRHVLKKHRAALAAAAKSWCLEAEGRLDAAPFLTGLARRYCFTLGEPGPKKRSATDLYRTVRIDGDIKGLSRDERAEFVVALEGAIKRTPWFSRTGEKRLRAQAAGTSNTERESREVVLEADWQERVAYQATEQYQEPYTEREMYTDYESYTEQQTYTDTEYYTETCGYGDFKYTCSKSRLVTKTRPVYRTRPVTRYRDVTRYRTKNRTVTRYRDEPRVHEYAATEHRIEHTNAWRVELQLESESPIVVELEKTLRDSDYTHDETFEPADLHPQTARLLSRAAVTHRLAQELADAARQSLFAHWRNRYCLQPATAEEAARCLAAQPFETSPAVAALATFFGEADAELIVHAVARQ